MNVLTKLKKIKNKRYLVLGAGGARRGVGCIFLETKHENWEILSQVFLPYPRPIQNLLNSIYAYKSPRIKLADLVQLDYQFTRIYQNAAQMTLAQAPNSHNGAHLAILGKFSLFQQKLKENDELENWSVSFGDANLLAKKLHIPVFSEFERNCSYRNSELMHPNTAGVLKLDKNDTEIVPLVNMGQLSRIIIANKKKNTIIANELGGPGTCLMNRVIQQADLGEDIDRDGKLTAEGMVNDKALDALVSAIDLQKGPPTQKADEDYFDLLELSPVKTLPTKNKLATLAAFSARSVYNSIRRLCDPVMLPESIYLAGGGVHNQPLVKYLSIYFDPIKVYSIEHLGVQPELGMTLSMGLTVDMYLRGTPPFKSNEHSNAPLGFFYSP